MAFPVSRMLALASLTVEHIIGALRLWIFCVAPAHRSIPGGVIAIECMGVFGHTGRLVNLLYEVLRRLLAFIPKENEHIRGV